MVVTASIQARMGSSRLPGKVLLQLGDKRVIEHVVARCRAAETIDKVVLTTGLGAENDAIREWCNRNDVQHMAGEESQLLSRHMAVATETDCDQLVRITGDCPFLPPEEIDRLVRAHNNETYTTNFTERMPIGTDIDVLSPGVLQRLQQNGETHPVKELRANTEKWNVTVTENEWLCKFTYVDIAVDTPDDYWLLVDATEIVGSDPTEIIELLSKRK